MTPEELEKVRERALRFVAPVGAHHTKTVQLVHDRDNLLAHVDAQAEEINHWRLTAEAHEESLTAYAEEIKRLTKIARLGLGPEDLDYNFERDCL